MGSLLNLFNFHGLFGIIKIVDEEAAMTRIVYHQTMKAWKLVDAI